MKKIISFDIGEKNFAYCVGTLTDDDDLVTGHLVRPGDTGPDAKLKQIIINKIEHHNIVKKKKQTVIESCIFITELLEKEINLITANNTTVHDTTIIIEQQMRANVRAQRLAQHVWSYFYLKFPRICIKFVPARLKTQHFLGKNTLDSRKRKKWAVVKVNEILNSAQHQNQNILTEINNLQKQDDVCDTILQLFAFLNIRP